MNQYPLIKLDELAELVRKGNQQEQADLLLSRVNEFYGPMDAMVLLRAMSEISKQAADKLVDKIIAIGVPGKYMGADVSIVRTAAKYDYSICGDPVLAGLEAQAEAVKKQIKERQGFLRAIGGEVKDEKTGEIVRTNEVAVEFVNDHGNNDTAVVKRAALLEQGQTVKITLPK